MAVIGRILLNAWLDRGLISLLLWLSVKSASWFCGENGIELNAAEIGRVLERCFVLSTFVMEERGLAYRKDFWSVL